MSRNVSSNIDIVNNTLCSAVQCSAGLGRAVHGSVRLESSSSQLIRSSPVLCPGWPASCLSLSLSLSLSVLLTDWLDTCPAPPSPGWPPPPPHTQQTKTASTTTRADQEPLLSLLNLLSRSAVWQRRPSVPPCSRPEPAVFLDARSARPPPAPFLLSLSRKMVAQSVSDSGWHNFMQTGEIRVRGRTG